MKVVAKKGNDEHRVSLSHWWPGRACRLPAVPIKAWKRSARGNTRWMTIASTDLDGIEVLAYARCCPRDNPSRAKGRFIALLRLARALRPLGYRLEKVA